MAEIKTISVPGYPNLTLYDTKAREMLTNRKTLNVLDIGADPTGKADCSTLINNELKKNNNLLLYFPAGTYKINSTLNINSDVIAVGNLITDNDIAFFQINSSHTNIIFSEIGNNDGLGTAITFNSQNQIRGIFIKGSKVVCKNGIIISAGDNGWKQEIVIEVNTMHCSNNCLALNRTDNTWCNEINVLNSALHGSAIAVNIVNDYNIDRVSFTNCSFEANDLVFKLKNIRDCIINNPRLLFGENNGNHFFDLTKSNVYCYGTLYFSSNTIVLDNESNIYYNGTIYNGYGEKSYSEVAVNKKATDGTQSNLFKCIAGSPALYVEFDSDSEQKKLPDLPVANNNIIVVNNTHSDCSLSIPYKEEYDAYSVPNGFMYNNLPFILFFVSTAQTLKLSLWDGKYIDATTGNSVIVFVPKLGVFFEMKSSWQT